MWLAQLRGHQVVPLAVRKIRGRVMIVRMRIGSRRESVDILVSTALYGFSSQGRGVRRPGPFCISGVAHMRGRVDNITTS
jgi:hypothetical protein